MKYRAEIDGLRALAVVPVIFFHAGFELFKGGFVGVDVFFVISGYLITSIIISEMNTGKFSISNFYERRARRILPALFFVMLFSIIPALIWLSPGDLKDFGQSLISTATFSSNILFWLERGYFGTALELKPLLHTWSLAVEEQYYILFPIFLIFTWSMGLKRISLILIVIFLFSLSLAHIASVYGIYDRVITGSFYLIPTRAWELLLGVFVAIYFNQKKFSTSQSLNEFISLAGLIMIIYSIIYFDKDTPFPSIYTLIPTLGTAMIIISAFPNTTVNKILSIKQFVFLGLLSYSAYLWHQPIFAFSRHIYSNEIHEMVFFVLSIVSIFFAYFSWKFVEKPFRNKSRFSQKGVFMFSLGGMLVFTIIGTILSLSNGFIKKYDEIEQKIYNDYINIGIYNPSNMRLAGLQSFDILDNRKKLLVIGDSFAEDLVNAVKESELDSNFQLSTYRMPSECGILYVERELIKNYQPQSCSQKPNFYNSEKLIKILGEADEVWIAAAWSNWQIEFLVESLNNIKKVNSKVILFGSKKFQIKSASQYRNNYGLEGLTSEFKISDSHKSITNDLSKISSKVDVQFIDPMLVICNSKKYCKHSFDGNGLISADSSHLTQYGAKYFGVNLKKYIENGYKI